MKIVILGATGLVGQEILKVIEERKISYSKIYLVGSKNSWGKAIRLNGKSEKVCSVEEALHAKPDYAIFSAGSTVSKEWAPKFAGIGTIVIDNSSAWRTEPDIPLIIPEINFDVIRPKDHIIANPNCSTIQMLMALYPIHRENRIEKIIVSTYQSVTGSGQKAMNQLDGERKGTPYQKFYPHPIENNTLPHCDDFLDNNFTKEEMKLVHETHKILNDNNIKITATAVRVPVSGGHSESVYIETENQINTPYIKQLLENFEGLKVLDNPSQNLYPMPFFAKGKDEVFVGRIRKDLFNEKALNLWIVADNLRKGAATNAVQILQRLIVANK